MTKRWDLGKIIEYATSRWEDEIEETAHIYDFYPGHEDESYLRPLIDARNRIYEMDFAGAIKIYENMIDDHPDALNIRMRIVDVLERMEDDEAALNMARECFEMNPLYDKALDYLFSDHMHNGKLDKALEFINSVRDIKNKIVKEITDKHFVPYNRPVNIGRYRIDPLLLFRLSDPIIGEVNLDSDRLPELLKIYARGNWQDELTVCRKNMEFVILDILVDFLFDKMELEGLERCLDNPNVFDGHTLSDMYLLGGVYLYFGSDEEGARYNFKQALKFDPKNYKARIALASMKLLYDPDDPFFTLRDDEKQEDIDMYKVALRDAMSQKDLISSMVKFGKTASNTYVCTGDPLIQSAFIFKGEIGTDISMSTHNEAVRTEYARLWMEKKKEILDSWIPSNPVIPAITGVFIGGKGQKKYNLTALHVKQGSSIFEESSQERMLGYSAMMECLGYLQGVLPLGITMKRSLLDDVEKRLRVFDSSLARPVIENYGPILEILNKQVWVVNNDFHPDNVFISQHGNLTYLIDHEMKGSFPIQIDSANFLMYSKKLFDIDGNLRSVEDALDTQKTAYNEAAKYFNKRFGSERHIQEEFDRWRDAYISVYGRADGMMVEFRQSADPAGRKELIPEKQSLLPGFMAATVHRGITYFGFFDGKPDKQEYRKDFIDNALYATGWIIDNQRDLVVDGGKLKALEDTLSVMKDKIIV